jgi:hypothetical protein
MFPDNVYLLPFSPNSTTLCMDITSKSNSTTLISQQKEDYIPKCGHFRCFSSNRYTSFMLDIMIYSAIGIYYVVY